MRTWILLLFIISLGCAKKNRVPEGVIPVKAMTEICWDMMVADELAAYRYPADLTKRLDSATVLYSQVVTAHGTTQAQLKKSLRYYESRPDLLQAIFDTLHHRATAPLSSKKDSLQVK